MFARKSLFSSIGRSTALATVAALALTTVEPSMALAVPMQKGAFVAADRGLTDVSAKRKAVRRSRGSNAGAAAAAAAFAGIVGTGLAIAAARSAPDYYDYGYYGGPGYYGGGPYYYGGYGGGVPYYRGHPLAGW